MSDTQTVDGTLAEAQRALGTAAGLAAGQSRWSVACNYLALAGRLAQYRETQRIWPEQPLASSLLWRTVADCERLAESADREDWVELEPLHSGLDALLALALSAQEAGA